MRGSSVTEANDVSTRNPTARPDSGGTRGGPRRRLLRGLRDARIRSKLSLILVVPVVAIVSLAGLRLFDSGQRAIEAGMVESLTSLSADISALGHELHRERMEAAGYLVERSRQPTDYNQQAKRTDDTAERYTRKRQEIGSVPDRVQESLRRLDAHLATLDGTRREVLARNTSVAQVVLRYGVIISDLVAYREELGPVAGNNALADQLRAIGSFSKAKAQAAEEQAITYAALASERKLDAEEYSSFLATLTGQQESLVAFSLAATPELRLLVEGTVTGDSVDLADRVAIDLTRSVGEVPAFTPDQVSNAFGSVTNLMRWTEEELDRQTLEAATAQRTAVQRQVIIESVVVLLTLALAVAFALLLARSMARSLGRLREGALTVAHQDLPAAVARLRDVQALGETSPDEIARQVRDPIALANRDEIGQVGQAFNVVHREAVRVAAEQAVLRMSVSAMFLNLARRSQTLVDRMIGELDQIERGEEDPKRLARLFQLDHLATRMRRNDENLLVLAGADSSPPRRDDALLVDALRAAQSEVELYDRIEFGTVDTDVSIAAHAVNDTVRLLAELLDNATRFSPPNTVVVADARRIGDYVLVQIEDHGLGLTDEQMLGLNTRLAAPSDVDVAAFRMMGLAVVARLASRYGIRVELRRNAEGGTVANIALPAGMLVLPKIRGREPVIGRPRPLAVEPGPSAGPGPGPAWSGGRGWQQPAVPDTVPAALGEWSNNGGDGFSRQTRPAVAVGMHVTGAAASSVAAAAGTTYPVAGMVDGHATVVSAPPVNRADDTTELPIFREMEAQWFRSHGPLPTHQTASYTPSVAPASAPPVASAPPAGYPSAGGYQGPTSSYQTVPPAYSTPSAPPLPKRPVGGSGAGIDGQPSVPRQREPQQEWRTAADTGWQAASQAAQPQVAGTTRSGLPKRQPGGQLVPGGVDANAGQTKTRRTPEEVRGLLSAYHRGVQRGRTGGGEAARHESDALKERNR
jgi:hypothetical protein